jgi:hypothetical protein
VISYERLLDLFWASHDPTARPWSQQYKAILFFDGPEQEAAARRSRDAVAARLGRPIRTEVRPLVPFTRAEAYHQKYTLRHDEVLMRELLARYRSDQALVDSTAAARLNGWLAGPVDPAQLARELPGLGLSPEAQAHLRSELGTAVRCQ